MKRRFALACTLALAGCATSTVAPSGTVVPAATIAPAVQPGVTTRASLLARFGPTTAIRFDNGVEVWRYLTPGPGGADGQYSPFGEYVIVLDARGVVVRARHAAIVYQSPRQK